MNDSGYLVRDLVRFNDSVCMIDIEIFLFYPVNDPHSNLRSGSGGGVVHSFILPGRFVLLPS